MKSKRGFKGFTLVELVIVVGVIAILSAVLIPTFSALINNSKDSAKYERASSARTDYFLENEDFEALSDMREYLILVDNTLYIVNENGDIVLSDFDYAEYKADDDYIEVQRAYETDESVKIYQPRALDAYGRAIKARNDYRRSHNMERTYFEMDNYIIRVTNDEGTGDAYFKIVFESEGSANNGQLVKIDQDLDQLYADGYEYEKVTEGENYYYGAIYKPTALTQVTYRIEKIQSDLLAVATNDENIKDGDFIYVIDGNEYATDENGIVLPVSTTKAVRSRVMLISDDESEYDDTELILNGYQKIDTDSVSETLVSGVTDLNKDALVYKAISCYAICFGYYDTTDTYQTWTKFRTEIYGSETDIETISFKNNISADGIKTIIVSDTVTALGYRAFANYEDLENVVLPETVINIEANPLANIKINTVRIHHSNGVFSDYGHKAIVTSDDEGNYELVAGTGNVLTNLATLPDDITSIRDYGLESALITEVNIVDIPVGKGTFKNCVYLTSVTHNLTTEIYDDLFSGCVALEYFIMPETVEIIGRHAFDSCVSLAGIDLPVTLAEIKVGAFYGVEGMMLYYADSKKTFEENVLVGADLSKVRIEYALKDITYNLGAGSVSEETPNPVKLDPTLNEELTLFVPVITYRYRFIDWSVKGTSTNNDYENIVAGDDLENPYKLLQSDYPEDITLTANYELIVFDIDYKIDSINRTADLVSGDAMEFTYTGTFYGEYNTTLSATINVPQLDKRGYTFDGWYLNGTKLGGNGSTFTQYGRKNAVVLTARFEVITYNISYDYKSGTVGVANPIRYTVESPAFTLSNPTKQDYIFTGWTGTDYDDPTEVVEIAHGSIGDRTYEAQYRAVVYNLTYNFMDGSDPHNPSTFTVDTEPYTLLESTKRGYTFKGWKNGGVNIGTEFVCANYHANTRLTAYFEPNVYNIEYRGAHVINFNNPNRYTFDTPISLSEPTMEVGYTFTGWTEEHGYVDGSYLIGAIDDIVIESTYTLVEYTIAYNLNTGSVSGTNPTKYTIESENIVLINPTRDGYEFRGWTGSNGNVANTLVTIPTGTTGNKSYTANWQLITYTISYTLNGGNVTGNPNEFTYESTDIVISNPTRTGYIFEGWTGTGLDVKTITITIPNHSTGNRSYTANWQVINYTLTYTLNGGSADNPATYNIETPTFKLVNPTRMGYDFAGWTGTDISGKSSDVTIARGSLGARSFIATWTPITYTINYTLTGGTVATANPTSYNIETATFTLNNPTRSGYTFDGWTGTNGNVASLTITIANGSTGNREYNANWTIIVYNLSYTMNGGTATNPSTYTVETTTFSLVNPTRLGYTFNGWSGTGISGKSTTVTIAKGSLGDRSYTANFTIINYTISYNTNNGVIDGSNPTTFTVETTSFTLINPTKNGYTFNGWSGTNITGTTNTVTIPKGSVDNRSYTANFTIITYTISYTLNSGSANNPTTYDVETAQFTLTNPTRAGYTFLGWSGTGIDGRTDTVTINKGSTGNRTYTASWKIIEYTLSYELNSGELVGSASNPSKYTVETATFTLNNPQKTGYTFDGWTGSNGTTAQTTITISKGTTGNKTYTANFTIITYTITYTLNGGSVATPNPETYNVTTTTFTLNNPTKRGYLFDGWTGTNGSTAQTTITINKGNTGDRTYTANWTVRTYTINYSLGGGSANNPSTYTVETTTFTLNNPTRAGYNFDGWTGTDLSSATKTVSIAKGSIDNRSYTATWSLITYTISYSLNGGSISNQPTSFNITTATFDIPNPTRTGYNFTGWSGSRTGTSLSIAKGTHEDLSLSANWAGIQRTVTFDKRSGSGGTGSVIATYGSPMPSATAPSRNYYNFGGYFTGTNGSGTQYYGSNMSSSRNWDQTANCTLYAKWTATPYTITYDYRGGSGSNPTSYTVESSAINLSTPSRTGKLFMGWTGSNDVSTGLGGYTISNPYVARDRDNIIGNEFSVQAGKPYRVYVTAKKTAGSLGINGGLWYTGYWDGAPYDGYGGGFTYMEDAGNGYGRYFKDVVCSGGKYKARFYIQIEQSAGGNGGTVWNLADCHVTCDPDMTGTSYTKSNSWYCNKRDHMSGNIFSVTPGVKYRVVVTAKRASGSLNMQGGIWYDNKTSGDQWDGVGGTFTDIGNAGDGWRRYAKDVTVPGGKQGGRVYIQMEQSHSGDGHAWYVCEISVTKYTPEGKSVTIPAGSTGNRSYIANWTSITVYFNKNGGWNGTDSIQANYGQSMGNISIPYRSYHNFAGYYNGNTQYFNSSGACVRNCDFTGNVTLVAWWNAREIGSTDGSTWSGGSYQDVGQMESHWWRSYDEGSSWVNWYTYYHRWGGGYCRLGYCYMDAYGERRWTRWDNNLYEYDGQRGSGGFGIGHSKCVVGMGMYVAASIYYGTAYNQTGYAEWRLGN